MNLIDAQNLAKALMLKHGVGHLGFGFDNGKRRLGACHFLGNFPQRITLSRHYTALLPESEIRDVILHEIAHAKAGISKGDAHGAAFRREARAIGHSGTRCVTPSADPEASVIGKCPNGHEFGQYRLPGRVSSCSKCSPGRFSKSHLLSWHKNGRKVPLSAMPVKYQNEVNRLNLKQFLVS